MDRAQHIANCIGSIQECERQLTVLAEQIQVTRDSATLASLHEKRLELLQHQDHLANSCTRAITTFAQEKEAHELGVSRHRQSSIINNLKTELPQWPLTGVGIELCGAIPPESRRLVPGQEVAAREQDKWLLGVVVRVDGASIYVEDMVPDSTSAKAWKLSWRNVIPLPVWAPQAHFSVALFPKGAQVLALYPRTTCFYQATVEALPTKSNPMYKLQFQDDDFGGRTNFQEVAVKHVIAKPTR
eukprot:m.19538 g.19538  ORF g.19538 m.19538 type:complete len:243 (-) comp8048_c0_seq1:160-888(-)